MDWRRVADLDVEERYWRRRLEMALRAENETQNLLRNIARFGGRPALKVRLRYADAGADVRRIRRRIDQVVAMRAARDAEVAA